MDASPLTVNVNTSIHRVYRYVYCSFLTYTFFRVLFYLLTLFLVSRKCTPILIFLIRTVRANFNLLYDYCI